MAVFDSIITEGLYSRLVWGIYSDIDDVQNSYEKDLQRKIDNLLTVDNKAELLQSELTSITSNFHDDLDKFGLEKEIKSKINVQLRGIESKIITSNESQIRDLETILGSLKLLQIRVKELSELILSFQNLPISNDFGIEEFISIKVGFTKFEESIIQLSEYQFLTDNPTLILINQEVSIVKILFNADISLNRISIEFLNEVTEKFRSLEIFVEIIIKEANNIKWDKLINMLIDKLEYERYCSLFFDLSKKEYVIELYNNLQKSDKKEGRKTDFQKFGIKWTGDSIILNSLYKNLIDYNIIVPLNGNENEFYAFFREGSDTKAAFIWNDDVNLLAYMFEKFIGLNYITMISEYNSIIRASSFFVTPDHNSIKNLKVLKNQYLNTSKEQPRRHYIIDAILEMN